MPTDRQLESVFQGKLIKKLERLLPGCIVLKNDSGYQQGIPDLSIFWGVYWAMLEVKPRRPTSSADFEPNQEWFIEKAHQMSFGACIYPENEREVLRDLQQAFGAGR
jgi:hypothetical protein